MRSLNGMHELNPIACTPPMTLLWQQADELSLANATVCELPEVTTCLSMAASMALAVVLASLTLLTLTVVRVAVAFSQLTLTSHAQPQKNARAQCAPPMTLLWQSQQADELSCECHCL